MFSLGVLNNLPVSIGCLALSVLKIQYFLYGFVGKFNIYLSKLNGLKKKQLYLVHRYTIIAWTGLIKYWIP